MFAVIYQFKFPGVSEAKVAAGFCSESLGGKIAEYDFLGLNILISIFSPRKSYSAIFPPKDSEQNPAATFASLTPGNLN